MTAIIFTFLMQENACALWQIHKQGEWCLRDLGFHAPGTGMG